MSNAIKLIAALSLPPLMRLKIYNIVGTRHRKNFQQWDKTDCCLVPTPVDAAENIQHCRDTASEKL
ncbi:hypothetical protein [Microseira wollei]|uniref:hypothetical protein n=1 Tax=Microseira wollei TaxID=467598 RepID=UPI001CFCA823|nr:hypothetical protein [Microseira wollei]